MNRFFCLAKNCTGAEVIIDDKEQVHHIKDVLRLRSGKPIVVFDECANEYSCIITEVCKERVSGKIMEKLPAASKGKRVSLTIACALAKNAAMDDIIAKLTQLDVDIIIPLLTERVIVRLDKDKAAKRQKRWQKIALSASQQSRRNSLPVIKNTMRFKEALAESKHADLKLIAHLGGDRKGLKEILSKAHPKGMFVFIGPEGDFTPQEVALAKEAGFVPVSLGETVLRVDTAAIAIAGFFRLYAHS